MLGAIILILLYVGVPCLLLVLGVLFYSRARSSRRGMRCPNCGEYVRIELMDADQRCNTCGVPLKTTGETHAQP
jgi:hypothetical protein